ncbi:MAG: aconitase/3-isopropylmalate dehydratase large subunit family protein [Anaerolineae bacterium]
MLATFVQKALARAAGLPHVAVGQIVDVQPDVILSHDNTAAIARLFRSLGRTRVRYPQRLAITLDHAVPAPSADHAQNHAEVRRFVAEQGIAHFFDAGRGICHQVLSEEALVLPGQMILGADSHTTHFGWLGAFGAGIGRSEVAALWATGALWLRVPETIRVELVGALPSGVTAKDLGLWLLKLLGPEAGIYRAVEIGGPGLRTLSLESRMVLPNLLAEAGAKSAYLEPDETVFAWLNTRLAARGQAVNPADALYPDPGASYLAQHTLDLAALEPLVAAPHNPANVLPLSQLGEVRVDQAFIGTCTNGRLEDLAAAAAVLRAPDGQVRRIAAGTRLLVIPASSQVMQDALAAGYIATFVAAGAMIGTPGCGPCMGNHFGVPASGETVISSANRNFRGRMGNRESSIYLASPAVVAASAVLGHIAHPAALAPATVYPSRQQDRPLAHSAPTVPASSAAPPAQPAGSHTAHHAGRAWVYGDDVNTDVIFPGKYTYTIKEEAEMAQHALEDLDPAFAATVQPGDILVGGRNWGCGSSREQAVTCLRAAGVRVLIAASFARIYFRNAINNGLLPIVCPEAVAAIQPGEQVSVDLTRYTIQCAAGEFAFAPFSPSVAAILAAGGLLPMLMVREAA